MTFDFDKNEEAREEIVKPEEVLEQLKKRYGDDWPEEALHLYGRMGTQRAIKNVPLYKMLHDWLVDTLKAGVIAKLEIEH